MIIKIYICSFCHKNQHNVDAIITGPDGVNICSECVSVCNKVLEERGIKYNQPLQSVAKSSDDIEAVNSG